MADDDEIDILGDFSFNSCFAQNNQGIPSCSSREDTVHPQWLLDSTETNWYDRQSLQSLRGPSRKLLGDSSMKKHKHPAHTEWNQVERKILLQEMTKYGRNMRKISQTLKTKSEAEIQAFIDAEFGVHLETSTYGLDKFEDHTDTPSVIQEEIVTDDSHLKKVVIIAPEPKHPFRKKSYNVQSKNSLLKPNVTQIATNNTELLNSSEIFYEDDMIIGSTESIGSELDMTDIVSRNIAKHQAKVKAEKKIGNHRRKVSRNYDKSGIKSKDLMKSPQGRQRKDSSLSDDSMKSPKMQIVLGSGQALPVSEGEQVIKIEKKKDSEPESDIEIDIDSDSESNVITSKPKSDMKPEEPIAVPLRKFEPMPRRQKKINLDGEGAGGYTIMHTAAGDLYQVGAEPRRPRPPKKPPVHLIRCRVYNADKPAPCDVRLHVSTLILMDAHAHSSRSEVMGLTGGRAAGRRLTVSAYEPAAAAAGATHCDMEPVSQAQCAERLCARGAAVCGWHHSHPLFPVAPSAQDLASQRALQRALEWRLPLVGFITSQHWPRGRTASQYSCLRVEDDENGTDSPVGYQFSVKLVPDLTPHCLPSFLQEVRAVVRGDAASAMTVDLVHDVCPQANMTYLEKCISSISHHMRSAGYAEDDPIVPQLIQGLRDVLR